MHLLHGGLSSRQAGASVIEHESLSVLGHLLARCHRSGIERWLIAIATLLLLVPAGAVAQPAGPDPAAGDNAAPLIVPSPEAPAAASRRSADERERSRTAFAGLADAEV